MFNKFQSLLLSLLVRPAGSKRLDSTDLGYKQFRLALMQYEIEDNIETEHTDWQQWEDLKESKSA